MLADALATSPAPGNLRELLAAVGHHPQIHGSVASELLTALRHRAVEEPDLALDEHEVALELAGGD